VIIDLDGGAMLDARFLGPAPSRHLLTQPSLQVIHHSPLTVISNASAHLVDENLAKVLDASGRLEHAAWLRLSRLDAQPAHLAESAARSVSRVERRLGGLSEAVVTDGPCGARTMRAAGAELADRLPTNGTLVVDNTLGPMDPGAVMELIDGWLAPAGDRRVVLLWRERPPRRVRRSAQAVLGPRALRMGPALAHRVSAESGLALPVGSIESLLRLTRGCAALVHPLLTEIAVRHPDVPLDVVARCHRRGALSDCVVRSLLARCGLGEREILSVTLDLGFWHASMTRSSTGGHEALEGVWLSPLEEGWFRLPPAFALPLERQLHATPLAPGNESAAQPRAGRSRLVPIEVPDRPVPPAALNGVRAADVEDVGVVEDADVVEDAEEHGPGAHRLEAKLLGGFEVTVDGRAVSFQNGPRGLMLLKYLLAHHPRPQQRDVLMDVFWPGVDPRRARSRLHVALSGLRRSFKDFIDSPVVEFRAGRYQISSELELRTDVEDFEQLAAAAGEAEQAAERATAIELCERAVDVYRGDFLVEEPYEDWALLRRETLRVKYLDLLDRLTTSYLAADRIGECISAAQQILHQDACREDAHRLLMRCYARQGRLHQVTRQFELCSRAIDSALGCQPSEATTTLYRSIRLEHAR
jgi:DNA-binding SARP family transcriptional activator